MIVRASRASLPPVRYETERDYRHDCPWCFRIRGKQDRAAKLYVMKGRGVGYCFKCHVRVVPENGADYGENIAELRFRIREIEKRLGMGRDEEDPQPDFNLSGWSVEAHDSPEGARRVAERGIGEEAARRYGLRYATRPFPCLVVPNRVWGEGGRVVTDYYQVRRLAPGPGPKYRSPEVPRPLYYSDRASSGRPAVIVEGAMSAVSAWEKTAGRYDPMAILGSSITPRQVAEFRSRVERAAAPFVQVMLDGGMERDAIRVADRITSGMPRCPEVRVASLPPGRDPNDATAAEVVGALERGIPYQHIV